MWFADFIWEKGLVVFGFYTCFDSANVMLYRVFSFPHEALRYNPGVIEYLQKKEGFVPSFVIIFLTNLLECITNTRQHIKALYRVAKPTLVFLESKII